MSECMSAHKSAPTSLCLTAFTSISHHVVSCRWTTGCRYGTPRTRLWVWFRVSTAYLKTLNPFSTCGVSTMQVDNRMRAWYIKNMSVGLLYQCSLGDLRLDSPVALLQNRRHEGLDFMEVVPMEHQLPAQRDQVNTVLQVNYLP